MKESTKRTVGGAFRVAPLVLALAALAFSLWVNHLARETQKMTAEAQQKTTEAQQRLSETIDRMASVRRAVLVGELAPGASAWAAPGELMLDPGGNYFMDPANPLLHDAIELDLPVQISRDAAGSLHAKSFGGVYLIAKGAVPVADVRGKGYLPVLIEP